MNDSASTTSITGQHELAEVPPGIDVVADVPPHRALVARRQVGVVAGDHGLRAAELRLAALGACRCSRAALRSVTTSGACSRPPGRAAWAWAGSWRPRAARADRGGLLLVEGLAAASEHGPTVCRGEARPASRRRRRAPPGRPRCASRLAAVTDDVLTPDQISALKTTVAGLMPGLRAGPRGPDPDPERLASTPSTRPTSRPAPRPRPPCCGPRGSRSRSSARAAARR